MDFLQIDALSPHAAIIKEWVWKEWGEDNNRLFMEKLIKSTLEGFYESAGWRFEGLEMNSAGHEVRLYKKDLNC